LTEVCTINANINPLERNHKQIKCLGSGSQASVFLYHGKVKKIKRNLTPSRLEL
jgi:hypothetical protein